MSDNLNQTATDIVDDVHIGPPKLIDRPWLFKPGHSGNPGGIDAKLKARVLRFARSKGMKALKKLEQIMDNPKAMPSTQAMCAIAILNRGFGMPKQDISVENQGRTLEEMLLAIYEKRAEDAKLIENAAETSSENSPGATP